MNNLKKTKPRSPVRPSPVRDRYGAIDLGTVAKTTATAIRNLVSTLSEDKGVDEHGSWDFGIDSTKNGKWWESLNWDCYGAARDTHSRKLLAVIQVRQAWRKSSWQWTRVRKNYFLCGRNEDNTVFAHPIAAAVIHSAIRRKDDVVRSCQDWMFGGADYRRVKRHGDVACVPVRLVPVNAVRLDTKAITIADSHNLSPKSFGRRARCTTPVGQHSLTYRGRIRM